MKKVLIEIVYWTWCLPQTFFGWLAKLIYKGKIHYWGLNDNTEFTIVYNSNIMPGAISLGKYIIIGRYLHKDVKTIKHEYGHQIQSFILGPLYLLVIGFPSFIWCWIIHPLTKKNYYWFYTEAWANKLGGVK